MSVPPLVAAELATRAPAVVAELRTRAERLGEAFARQFGLTEEHEYLGWKLLLLLAWELWENKLKQPVRAVWTFQQQLSGLVEAMYKFYGGTATAFEDGAAFLAKISNPIADATTVESWLVAAGNWGWSPQVSKIQATPSTLETVGQESSEYQDPYGPYSHHAHW